MPQPIARGRTGWLATSPFWGGGKEDTSGGETCSHSLSRTTFPSDKSSCSLEPVGHRGLLVDDHRRCQGPDPRKLVSLYRRIIAECQSSSLLRQSIRRSLPPGGRSRRPGRIEYALFVAFSEVLALANTWPTGRTDGNGHVRNGPSMWQGLATAGNQRRYYENPGIVMTYRSFPAVKGGGASRRSTAQVGEPRSSVGPRNSSSTP
jgi:hypothetical protein